MDVDSATALLGLDLLPVDRVHTEWKDGYFNEVEVPAELDLHLQSASVPETLHSLSRWILSKVQTRELQRWSVLVEQGLEFKKFLYLIHYFLSTADEKLHEEQHRTDGIFAARLYFSFLAVPQGGPFLIYQRNLFCQALKVLQCGHLLRVPEVQSPSKRRSRNVRFSLEEPQSPLYQTLPRSEADHLRTYLNDALRDLLKLLRSHENGIERDDVPLIVESLSTIAMQETVPSDLLSQNITESSGHSSSSLAQNAFFGLLTLCQESYGDVKNTIRIIMKIVFDAFLMGFKKEAEELTSVHVNAVRDVFTDFVYHVCCFGNENACNGVITLFQHLCVFAPDRAELRSKLVTSTVGLLLRLPQHFRCICCNAIVVMSCHSKATVRLFCVEVLSKILNSLEVPCTDEIPEELQYKLHKLLFASILARIQDASALVCSKAINCLISYLQDSSECDGRKIFIRELFIEPYSGCSSIKGAVKKKFKNFNKVASALQTNSHATEIYLPCALSIVNELFELCKDDKVLVRKSALQLLNRILHLNFKFIDMELIADIGSHCRDESVLIRKMMVQDFTDLLLVYSSQQQLLKQWTLDVVPAIFDTETTVVEKALESLERAFLKNMVPFAVTQHPNHRLPWILMNLLSHFNLLGAFLKACSLWKEETLRQLMLILKTQIGMEKPYNDSAWVTISCVAKFVTIKDPQFILDFYHEHIYCVPSVSIYISQLVMEALWLTWRQLPASDKSSLAHEFDTDLYLFKVPVPLISRAIDIRYGLHVNGRERSDTGDAPKWAVDLIKRCEDSIFEVLKLDSQRVQDEEGIKRFSLTLSSICLYYPGLVRDRVINQLLHMLSPQQEATGEFWSGQVEEDLKTGLVVALGKFGIQKEEFASKLIEALGPLLSVTKESALKNNILICLSDLCIRYTSLGENLLPDMCVCLKDSLPSVRENTLKVLTDLIQHDYIKMRNNLMFHLLTMINDNVFNIVAMTKIFFVNTVLRKKSNYFASSFTTSIFHYNQHDRSSNVPLSSQEKKVFDISGSENQNTRRNIYRFMLSNSTDDDRFTISCHLCIDICQAVLENRISLDHKGVAVLKDCLFVMDCDEIWITDSKDGEDDDCTADEEVSAQMINIARKTVVSELVKKHVIETEIPTLVKLKKQLLLKQPQLVPDIDRVLKNTIMEHKIDVDDINDPLLAKELRQIRRT